MKIRVFLFFLSSFLGVFAQDEIVNDSMRVVNWYDKAVENSDQKPKKAKLYLDTIVQFVDSIQHHRQINNKFIIEKLADSYHFLSYYERRESNFDQALLNAQKSIKVKEKHHLYEALALSYYQRALAWIAIDDSSEAFNDLIKAEQIANRYQKGKQLLQVYSALGSVSLRINDTINAYNFYQKSITLADSIGNNNQRASSYANYASFLRRIGRFEENFPYLKKALELHELSNNKIGIESGYYALGIYYRHINEPKESIKYLKKAIVLNKELQSDATLPYRYLSLSTSYKNIGNYQKAYETYVKYKETLDKRNDIEKVRRMSKIKIDFELEKARLTDSLTYEQKLILTKAALQQRTTNRIWSIVIVTFCLIGIAIYLYRRSKQKIKDQAYQNIILSNKIATKTEEVNDLLKETIQHIRSKERIAENLQKLSTNKEGVNLKSIIADLKASRSDNERLMLIKQNIEQVNYEFIKKLKSNHPELSKTDIEICSLFRIGLGRKEVADLRNTSLEAVKKSRSRLRKKMKLSSDTNLEEYINSI